MSLSNEYIVSFRCLKGEKAFAVLHRLAPLLKIAALATAVPAIFFPLLFIAVGGLLMLSASINYFKWFLVFNMNYSIDDGVLTVKKIYKYHKSKLYFSVPLTEIAELSIVTQFDAEELASRVECYCEQTHFKLYISIKLKDNPNNYVLVADEYFYSLLEEGR